MSLDAAQKRLLRAAFAKRPRAELRRLFAAVRGNDDRALLEALAPPPTRAPRVGDPLLRDVRRLLKPVLAPAAEKAAMLVEHLAGQRRRKLAIEANGLAAALRGLRAAGLTDDQIRAGAESLMTELRARHDARETVV
jgi:hypothetical protein